MWFAILLFVALTLVSPCERSCAAEKSKASPQTKETGEVLAARVKEILRTRCFECHGGSATHADINVLDHARLLAKKDIVPGNPQQSRLLEAVVTNDEDARMPKDLPALSATDIDTIRSWISAAAPAFPVDVKQPIEKGKDDGLKAVVGVDYVLKQILVHQRMLPVTDRPRFRYFSCNHLLARGATREELNNQRDAFAKAINHLSREPDLVAPKIVDGETSTVFAVDLRDLGWQKQPLQVVSGDTAKPSSFNLYDLVLLEYPYGIIYSNSATFDSLVQEYLTPAALIRPIPYVRTDWFCSVATLPPLYHDLLQLPNDLTALEQELGVNSEENLKQRKAKRAAMSVSGVSRNNRAVERHPYTHGAYWKSIDYASSKGKENIFTDPINLDGTGGEMIFTLPNGLQAYYLATGKGVRLDAAPTSIVTDKFSDDKTVRNGLSCIRCHDRGMKDFQDDVRPAAEQLTDSGPISKRDILALYPAKDEMNALVERDRMKFLTAMNGLLGKAESHEVLTSVTQRFIDAPLQQPTVIGELGLADSTEFKAIFRQPQFASMGLMALASSGVVRRDMWEDYFDQVVRTLGLGKPVVPIDGLTRRDYRPSGSLMDVRISSTRKNNIFSPGDELAFMVKNNGKTAVFIELVGTGTNGENVIMVPASTTVAANSEFRFPKEGSLRVQPALGRELITLFASESAFPPGQVLRGKSVADRVVHPLYDTSIGQNGVTVKFDAAQILKQTIEIETR